jgi:hypothetical protein
MANPCWDASIARPLFDCWRASATQDDVIKQAISGSWIVRTLALYSLADVRRSPTQSVMPLITMPSPPPPQPGVVGSRAGSNRSIGVPTAVPSSLVLDQPTRDRLLQSSIEVLSRDISGLPVRNTLSYTTAQLAREALWEFSGRNMSLALRFADRIVPVSGRYTSTGRFGESYDLASKDRSAYVAFRRPRQLLLAALAALLALPVFTVRRWRKLAVAFLVSLCMWGAWSFFQTDVRELPPPPLSFLTVSCLAFLAAGLVAGFLAVLQMRSWLKPVISSLAAAACAFVVCAYTRSSGLFPIGSEGWELIFDPIGSAVLAAPAALTLSLGLGRWKS